MSESINTIEYALYPRKSTDVEDKQILSIDSQYAELRKLAERDGLKVALEEDESHTAKKPGRPVFNHIVDEIEKGKIQGIIAWSADRLSRNSVDTGKLIYL